MWMQEHRPAAAVARILLVAALASLWASETGANVEEITVLCGEGEPISIEVAPATERVELKFGDSPLASERSCVCFETQEGASAWLAAKVEEAKTGELGMSFTAGALAQRGRVIRGVRAGPFIQWDPDDFPESKVIVEPEAGIPVDVVRYCFTSSQYDGYLKSLYADPGTEPASE